MINWFKSFFKKKIGLPFWMFVLGGNPTTSSDEEYALTLEKICENLIDGKNVIIRIDGQLAIISYKKGKTDIRFLEKDEYEWDGT